MNDGRNSWKAAIRKLSSMTQPLAQESYYYWYQRRSGCCCTRVQPFLYGISRNLAAPHTPFIIKCIIHFIKAPMPPCQPPHMPHSLMGYPRASRSVMRLSSVHCCSASVIYVCVIVRAHISYVRPLFAGTRFSVFPAVMCGKRDVRDYGSCPGA